MPQFSFDDSQQSAPKLKFETPPNIGRQPDAADVFGDRLPTDASVSSKFSFTAPSLKLDFSPTKVQKQTEKTSGKSWLEQREDDVLGATKEAVKGGIEDIASAFKTEKYEPTEFDKKHPVLGPFLHGAYQPFRPIVGAMEVLGASEFGTLEGVTKPVERATGIPSWASDIVAGIVAPAAAKRGISRLLDQSATTLDNVSQPARKVFSPASVSPLAERVAAIKREQLGQASRDIESSEARLTPFKQDVQNWTPAQRKDFINYMEGRSKGVQLQDKVLQPVADELKANYELRAKKIKETPSLKDTNLYTDYLTRSFTGTPEQQQQMARFLSKQGSGKNLKARKYASYEEAEAAAAKAGMKPKFDNFIDQANDYNRNMDMYIAHNRAFDMMRKEKLIKYGPPGRAPVGWVPLTGRLASKTGIDKKTGAPIHLQAYAPVDAARVYNNFLSAGLGGDAGKALQTAQHVFNSITMLKLGLSSVWHAGITGTAAISSDLARGTRQALKATSAADRAEGVKTILKAPFAPYRVAREGAKYNKQWLRLTDYGPNVEKLVDTATRANAMQSKRPAYMNAAGPKTFREMFSEARAKPLTGAPKAFAEGFGRTMQKVSAPMFDKWIPDMKRGVIIERLQQWIKEHPNSTQEQQLAYARQLGDSVDNRFGEMMRDNLFWNRTLRDAMQFGLLSYSWVAGAGRMLSGAAKESYQTLRHGRELGPNAEYLLANAVTAAVANSVYQYLHTGEGAQGPKDLFFPRTGGTQQVGNQSAPERAVLPSGHWTQIAEYLHDPLAELYNEGNPGAKVFYEALTNRDYRGMPIAKPRDLWQDDWLKEVPDAVWQYAKYIGGQALTPISIQSYFNRNKGTGITPAETIGMGARPAPAFISAPDIMERYQQIRDKKQWKAKERSDRRLEDRRETPIFNFSQ